MPNQLSSRYGSTGRVDRTLHSVYVFTSRERIYRSNTPAHAQILATRRLAQGRRLAKELRQYETEELDLEDLVATIAEFGSQVRRRLSSRLLALLQASDAQQCTDCELWTMPDNLSSLDDNSGDCVCDSCRDIDCSTCGDCGNLVRQSDTTWVSDTCYCDSCHSENFVTCDYCRESIPNDETNEVDGNSTWCSSCCSDNATYCESSETYRTRPCDDCDCDSCHGDDCNCRLCLLVLDYSTTLCGALGNLPANRIASHVMGAELECEVDDRREFARDLRNIYPATSCHCKRDGSLDSDKGVEIVTGHGIQTELMAVLETAANLARRDYAGQSHNGDSCGLHIGLDRSQFSSALQARIIVFWNSGENYKLLRQFTRRDYRNLSYCQIKPEKACDAFIARPDLSSREKYEIVNTRHATHLEFRGFRGSLLIRTLRACVSLVSLIASYCEIATTAAELTSGRFIDWLLREVAADDSRRLAVLAYLSHRGQVVETYAANANPVGLAAYPLFQTPDSQSA